MSEFQRLFGQISVFWANRSYQRYLDSATHKSLVCTSAGIEYREAIMADAPNSRRLLMSERAPGRNYDLYEGTPVEVYVDGASGALLGPSVCRLQFHSVIDTAIPPGGGEQIENRQTKLSVIIPTPQCIEFLTNTLAAIAQNNQQILQGFEQVQKALISSLSKVKPNV